MKAQTNCSNQRLMKCTNPPLFHFDQKTDLQTTDENEGGGSKFFSFIPLHK